MKRKLTALLLTMCLLLTAFPLSAAAAEKITIRFKAGEHVKGFFVGWEQQPEMTLRVNQGLTLRDIIDQNSIFPDYDAGCELQGWTTLAGADLDADTYVPGNGDTIVYNGKWKTITRIFLAAEGSRNLHKGGQGLISVTARDAKSKDHKIPASEYEWTIVDPHAAGTKVEVDEEHFALLTIDPNETATELRIKAVFRHQTGIEDTFKVKISDMPSYTGLNLKKSSQWSTNQTYGLTIEGQKTPTEVDQLPPILFHLTLTGNTSPNTTINKAGHVSIAKDELSSSLTITAEHKTNSNLKKTETFPVTVPQYILAIKPAHPKMKRGESIQLSAYASYTSGNGDVEVKAPFLTWEKVNAADTSTITPDGKFTYAEDQMGDQVTVKAKFQDKERIVIVQERYLDSIQITEMNSHSAVNPGGELQFKVTGKDNFNEDVEFAPGEIMFELIAGGTVAPTLAKTSEDTRINPTTGKLAVGRDELKDILTVKTSHAATGKSVQMPINVNRGAYTLKLKPQNATIAKGESKQFTAYVVEGSTEVALKPTDLIWKAFVDTAEATQSAITVNGVFTYGAAETATEVAIKATLKYDSTKMANAVVKLGASSTPPLNGYDNGNSSNNSSNNSSSNTGGPAAPAPQQPKKAEDNKPKPQDKKMDKTSEIIGRFQDIAGHWAQKAIVKAIEKGIFKGVAENSFAPDRQMSRAEFITVLGRMSEQAAVLREVPFKDVDANAYYAQHVAWGMALGLMKGFEDGTFRPEAKITREQAAVIFANFLKDKKLPESPATAFGDEENISGWAKEAVKKAAALGLLKGKDGGRFAPKDVLTRAEMAQILDNLSNMLEK